MSSCVGRLIRAVRGELESGGFDASSNQSTFAGLLTLLEHADRVRTHHKNDKHNLYGLRSLEVERIRKGTARNQHTIGATVNRAITDKQGLIAEV